MHSNLKRNHAYFFAGQMTGVEGYLESAASGLMVGLQVERYLEERSFIDFPINYGNRLS